MRRTLAMAFVVVALLAACSKEKETDTKGANSPCAGDLTGPAQPPSQLPPGFPAPAGVLYFTSHKAGPSTILSAVFFGDLGDAVNAYKSGFQTAGYNVTRSEQDIAVAEVDWSGGNTTGEVKMIVPCDGRVNLNLTIRPA